MAGSNKNLFVQVTQRFGVLSARGLNDIGRVRVDRRQTFSNSSLDQVRHDAESMGEDLVLNFNQTNSKKPPNRYCSTLRRTVKELSDRYDLVFKGMVSRLKPNETNTFPTFVIVADEIFEDGQVTWGRIVAVYAFGARLAKYYVDNIVKDESESDKISDSYSLRSKQYQKKIGLFVGKYVANKLGIWILDNGGWVIIFIILIN